MTILFTFLAELFLSMISEMLFAHVISVNVWVFVLKATPFSLHVCLMWNGMTSSPWEEQEVFIYTQDSSSSMSLETLSYRSAFTLLISFTQCIFNTRLQGLLAGNACFQKMFQAGKYNCFFCFCFLPFGDIWLISYLFPLYCETKINTQINSK